MIDPRRLRSTMGRFCTGVTVVTTARDGQVHAMTANAFTSVSLQPPLVLVSIDHRTRMHALLPDTRHFGVSVLASDQERVAWHFAGRPMADEKFALDGRLIGVPSLASMQSCFGFGK